MDTLSYFLPTDLTRTLAAPDGGMLSYYQRGNLLYAVLSNVAWRESAMWTLWQIRARWICLLADTGNALPGVKLYTLTPGFWMPREAEVGWTRHFKSCRVEHFDMDCQSMGIRRSPYRNTLLSRETIDLGGDLGPTDCICLEYHRNDERHYYGRHSEYGALGLVRWSKPGYPTGTFNRVGHSPCRMLPVCGRG